MYELFSELFNPKAKKKPQKLLIVVSNIFTELCFISIQILMIPVALLRSIEYSTTSLLHYMAKEYYYHRSWGTDIDLGHDVKMM